MRTLITPTGAWRYLVGRQFVRLVSPTKQVRVVSCSDIVGCTPDEWDRGRWKGYSSVTPLNMRRYVDAL